MPKQKRVLLGIVAAIVCTLAANVTGYEILTFISGMIVGYTLRMWEDSEEEESDESNA